MHEAAYLALLESTNSVSFSITMSSEQTLLTKMQCMKDIISRLRSEQENIPAGYSFELFCRDLDVSDVYVQRLLELLVMETAKSSEKFHESRNLLTQVIVEES